MKGLCDRYLFSATWVVSSWFKLAKVKNWHKSLEHSFKMSTLKYFSAIIGILLNGVKKNLELSVNKLKSIQVKRCNDLFEN